LDFRFAVLFNLLALLLNILGETRLLPAGLLLCRFGNWSG
jgi:hypothetical protein